jgi:hypothetical protein
VRTWRDRWPRAPTLARLALAAFVIAWIFGPYELRAAVPIWLPFLIALGLELNFFLVALRGGQPPRPDRRPQEADRERYGYGAETDELLLVRERGEELWVPYSGEPWEEIDALIADARDERDEPPGAEAPAERRRPYLGLGVGVALIGALALVFWLAESRTGWNGIDPGSRAEATQRFSREASRVAGKPVTIRCDEAGEYVGAVQHADGVAAVGGGVAYLTPERCLDLYRLAFEDEVRSNRTGRAIVVLAHEAWHLRGVSDEGVTECYAFQSGVELGERLGLSPERARRLMRRQFVENGNRLGSSFEYRVPPDCREGGRYDLNPETTRFP